MKRCEKEILKDLSLLLDDMEIKCGFPRKLEFVFLTNDKKNNFLSLINEINEIKDCCI